MGGVVELVHALHLLCMARPLRCGQLRWSHCTASFQLRPCTCHMPIQTQAHTLPFPVQMHTQQENALEFPLGCEEALAALLRSGEGSEVVVGELPETEEGCELDRLGLAQVLADAGLLVEVP